MHVITCTLPCRNVAVAVSEFGSQQISGILLESGGDMNGLAAAGVSTASCMARHMPRRGLRGQQVFLTYMHARTCPSARGPNFIIVYWEHVPNYELPGPVIAGPLVTMENYGL